MHFIRTVYLCLKRIRHFLVGLILVSFLMQSAIARPVKFGDYYRIAFNGEEVGSLHRYVIPSQESKSHETEIYFSLDLNQQPPTFDPEDPPLPFTSTLLEYIQRLVGESAHYTRLGCVLMLTEQLSVMELGRTPIRDRCIWRVNLNDSSEGFQLARLEGGELVGQETVMSAYKPDPDVEADEGLGQDEPSTLLGSFKEVALSDAPHPQEKIEHVYIFGETMESAFERLMERQSQGSTQTSERAELILFINPLTASVNRQNNLPGINLSSEILRYDPQTNRIIQEELENDPHPSYAHWEYQLNENRDQITGVTFIRAGPDSENDYVMTFSLESGLRPREQDQAMGQAASPSNSSNTRSGTLAEEVAEEDEGRVTLVEMLATQCVRHFKSE